MGRRYDQTETNNALASGHETSRHAFMRDTLPVTVISDFLQHNTSFYATELRETQLIAMCLLMTSFI
jgi:hypothetical protein